MTMKQLKISLDDALRARLDEASAAANRSLGEEIRQRIEHSFAWEAVDPETRELLAAIIRFAHLLQGTAGSVWHADKAAHAALGEMISLWLKNHPPKHRGPPWNSSIDKPGSPFAKAAPALVDLGSEPDQIARSLYALDGFLQTD